MCSIKRLGKQAASNAAPGSRGSNMSAYNAPTNGYIIRVVHDSMPERLKPKYVPALVTCQSTSNAVRMTDIVTQDKLSAAGFSSLSRIEKILQDARDPLGVTFLRSSKNHDAQTPGPSSCLSAQNGPQDPCKWRCSSSLAKSPRRI